MAWLTRVLGPAMTAQHDAVHSHDPGISTMAVQRMHQGPATCTWGASIFFGEGWGVLLKRLDAELADHMAVLIAIMSIGISYHPLPTPCVVA